MVRIYEVPFCISITSVNQNTMLLSDIVKDVTYKNVQSTSTPKTIGVCIVCFKLFYSNIDSSTDDFCCQIESSQRLIWIRILIQTIIVMCCLLNLMGYVADIFYIFAVFGRNKTKTILNTNRSSRHFTCTSSTTQTCLS